MRSLAHHFAETKSLLQAKTEKTCVRFPGREVHSAAGPLHVEVAVEYEPSSGRATLLVRPRTAYAGSNAEVRQWMTRGARQFPSLDHLHAWLDCHFGDGNQVSTGAVTDLSRVQPGVTRQRTPVVPEERLVEVLEQSVKGQSDAIRTAASIISRHLAKRLPLRPAVLFLVGPTGVGKTKTAEMIPQAIQALAGSESRYGYLRLDMSEYQESHRVSQLLGAPQGYIGYGDGAQLSDALRANGRMVIVLDEIDKAHPNIIKSIMNVLDAGRLSSPQSGPDGHDIDCRHSIFIFTSNKAASEVIRDLETREGFSDAAMVDDVCRNRLRTAGVPPEVVGRIGHFLVFRPLNNDARKEVAVLSIRRVAAQFDLDPRWIDPEVVSAVLQHSRANGFGVRTDEYAAESVLGKAFLQAVYAGLTGPVSVRSGPPISCSIYQPPVASNDA